MGALIIYATLYLATLMTTPDVLVGVAATLAFMYASFIVINSDTVGIWYGIPFTYDPLTSHNFIVLGGFTIPSPRIHAIVKGLST